jgi:hypothetical protein
MAYRPYPNADRALRQIARHYPDEPVIPMPECLRPMAASFARLRVNTRQAMQAWRPDFMMDGRTGEIAPYPVDEYRLSTR